MSTEQMICESCITNECDKPLEEQIKTNCPQYFVVELKSLFIGNTE